MNGAIAARITPWNHFPGPGGTAPNSTAEPCCCDREQGLGDTIQFIRYARLIKQRGGTVVVECLPSAGADCWQPVPTWIVLSWPENPCRRSTCRRRWSACRASLARRSTRYPAKVPYLGTSEESYQQWKTELEQEPGFKIGVAWQGNPVNTRDHFRSFPLEHLSEIAAMPGVAPL